MPPEPAVAEQAALQAPRVRNHRIKDTTIAQSKILSLDVNKTKDDPSRP